MRNRLFLIFPLLCSMMFCTPAYALDSDLSYDFITENEEEFVIVGESNINISGQIPDYLYDIYDISPQPVYDSEYGSNVVTPRNDNLVAGQFMSYLGCQGYNAAPFVLEGGLTEQSLLLITGCIKVMEFS